MTSETDIPDQQKCPEGTLSEDSTQTKGPSFTELVGLVDTILTEEELADANILLTEEQEDFLNKCLAGKVYFDSGFGDNGSWLIFIEISSSISKYTKEALDFYSNIWEETSVQVDYYSITDNEINSYNISKRAIQQIIKGTHPEIKLLEYYERMPK